MRFLPYILLVGLLATGCDQKPAPKQEKLMMVSLPPPPVKPPPTPPPQQQPPEPKIADQKQTIDPDPKPAAAKPEPVKAPDEPPPSMGSNIKGNGSDGFGLSGSGNGGFVGRGGKGNGSSDRYAAQRAQLQGAIATSLRQDKRTRAASFNIQLRLWIDTSGKITRAEPVAGDDSASAAAALVGQRVFEGLPEGFPIPVLTRVAGRRPN
jgi:hypothetical protein